MLPLKQKKENIEETRHDDPVCPAWISKIINS